MILVTWAFWRAVIAVWAIGFATLGRPGPHGTRHVGVVWRSARRRERGLGARPGRVQHVWRHSR